MREFFENHDNAVSFLIFGFMLLWGGALLSVISGWGIIMLMVGTLFLLFSYFGL